MATCALLNFDFDNGLSRGTCSDLPETAGPAGPRTGKGPFSPIGPGPAIFAGPLKHWRLHCDMLNRTTAYADAAAMHSTCELLFEKETTTWLVCSNIFCKAGIEWVSFGSAERRRDVSFLLPAPKCHGDYGLGG
jgi:hypothetical protein